MTINEVLDKATILTEKEEQKLLKEIAKIYAVTYKEAKAILSNFVNSNSKDGKIDIVSANKYGRSDKVQNDLLLKVKFAQDMANKEIDKHLNAVYKNNYYFTGYAIEGASGTTVINKTINNDILGEALKTPLDKLAIQTNADKVKQNIKTDIIVGIQQQKSLTEVADMVKKSLETNANNAVRIAQTEQTRVMNQARFAVAEKAQNKGVEVFKVWDARLDRKTRPSHSKLDGDAIPLDEKFSNGLMYPADPSGEAKEVVNCRCSLTFITGDGQLAKDYEDYQEWLKNLK